MCFFRFVPNQALHVPNQSNHKRAISQVCSKHTEYKADTLADMGIYGGKIVPQIYSTCAYHLPVISYTESERNNSAEWFPWTKISCGYLRALYQWGPTLRLAARPILVFPRTAKGAKAARAGPAIPVWISSLTHCAPFVYRGTWIPGRKK